MKIRNLPKTSRSMIGLLALASMPVLAASDAEQTADEKKSASKDAAAVLPEVSVSGQAEKAESSIVEKYKLPMTVETVTKQEMDEKINVFNTEDAIKYEPSILVRKRYVGDTNAPVQTRTATTSQSARTLIYADGILLSTLLNNNNGNTGSPRWNTVAPNEIAKTEIMYGPFSAAYSGNSMGGVVNITTKMPEKFEAYADAQASWQDYKQYGHSGTYQTQNYSGGIGDRVKDLSFRFDYNHLDSYSQPIAYATQVTAPNAKGLLSGSSLTNATSVTGAYMTQNTYGQPMAILGETALNHTIQDNFKWKLAYDITSTLKASYTLGMWQNNNEASVNSFLKNAAGNTVNSGNVKWANGSTSLSSAMLPSIAQQTTWSHGMNLHSETGGKFDWELVGSVVDLSEDLSKAPTSATTSTGKMTSMNGTNWHTVDAKGIWRPGDFYGNHEVSFGFHHDLYELANPVTKTAFWQADSSLPIASNDGSTNAAGKTQTEGYWAQDSWDFAKDWNFTAGGRLESWQAFDGVNSSWVNTGTSQNPNYKYQVVNQNNKHDLNFSPKGKLTWSPSDQWKFGAAIAKAYRYPTVGEMFQTYTTASNPITLVTGNPNLKPENALSSEISAEYFVHKGKYRLSFFQEQVQNAIFSTMSSVPNNGSYQYTSVVNNIGQTDAYGIEFSGNQSDVGIEGLDLFGSATWTDARITNNSASDKALQDAIANDQANGGATYNQNMANNPNNYAASTSQLMPRIPRWRATFGATYHVNDKLSTTVNGRYSDAAFGTLNNSDINHKTYVGVGGYFVVDTKINYKLTKQFTLSGGIDNINNENYWIYHPFPQRTYMAQLKFNY